MISKGLGIITKARKYLNRETLLKLYNAFVFPYLTYCVEVWGTAQKKYLDPLIKIKKKIVRIITFSPYLCHTDPIFKDLNLLPISKLVTQRIGLLMFKYSIHSLPSVIEDLFTCNTSVSNHNTRNKFIFGIKFKTISMFTLHTAHLKMHLNLSSWFTI